MKSQKGITRRKFLQYMAMGGIAVPVFSGLILPSPVQGAVTAEIFRFPPGFEEFDRCPAHASSQGHHASHR